MLYIMSYNHKVVHFQVKSYQNANDDFGRKNTSKNRIDSIEIKGTCSHEFYFGYFGLLTS